MELEKLGAWRVLLEQTLCAPYFSALSARVDEAYAAGTVFPPKGICLRRFP